MTVNYQIIDGLLMCPDKSSIPVDYIPSPNFNERPQNSEISLLVIHNISLPPKSFGGGFVQDFFQNKLNVSFHPYFEGIADVKVSSHVFIDRGGRVIQFVPFHLRAWHAGISSFLGYDGCNDISIGIELEGADDIPYTQDQYDSLTAITLALLKAYPKLNTDRIVGHCDIAKGRKTDPGPAFDWDAYLNNLKNIHHMDV